MSSSLNWPMADGAGPRSRCRRSLLGAFLAAPLAAWAGLPPSPGLRRWGTGQFRRFGLLIYEATLWAGDDPQRPPLALRLDYRRTLSGAAIADASIREMRRLGGDETALGEWGERLARLFPDVRPGDHITGIYQPDRAVFLYNGQPLGEIDDAAFARRFFAIWLDPRTSAPGLRAELLRPPGG